MSDMSPSPAAVWFDIDAVVVINLDSRADRWNSFQKINSGKLPGEKLHRLSAVCGTSLPTYGKEPWFTERTGERARSWGGVGGCILSHRNAIRMAKEKGWNNVLIVEDDVSLPTTPAQWERLHQALTHLNKKGAWFLYIGYGNSQPYGTRIAGDLWRIEGVLGTHAYMVSADAYDQVLEHLPADEEVWNWVGRYRAIDTWYRDFMQAETSVRAYCISPALVELLDMGSDIASKSHDFSTYLSMRLPKPLASLNGLLHRLSTPFRRLKLRLNSMRTLRRMRRGGLPGYKVRQKR